jgi:hypothetical protein
MSPKRCTRTLATLLIGLLALPGCLASQISAGRADRVATLSRFDSGCPAVQLVEALGNQRYKLRGCGSVFIYACVDRPRSHSDLHHHGRSTAAEGVAAGFALLDLALTGGMDPAAPCDLVSVYTEPPPVLHRPMVPAPSPARFEGDGSSSRPAVGLPELPDAAEVKRAMRLLEPELRHCDPARGPGWVEVSLRVEARGKVQSAAVKTSLPPAVRRCVEEGLGQAQLAPFARGPVWLAYLLDLR